MIRGLMIDSRLDIITELEKVIREHYPAKDEHRLEKVLAVIHNRSVWTPEEFANELPAISSLTAALGGAATERDLLTVLKNT